MQAELNFIRPLAQVPKVDLTRADWGKDQLSAIARPVEIGELEVDEQPAAALRVRGFAAVPLDAPLPFDAASDDWRAQFIQTIARTVKQVTGARGVIVPPISAVIRRGTGSDTDLPLLVCHSDFTNLSATSQFSGLLNANRQIGRVRRYAVYNAWWLASAAPQDRPLALCDARTVAPADVVTGDAVVHDATGAPYQYGEIALFRYNPAQRWYFYPKLASDRVLLFAGHDSDPRFASLVPHSAFDNPACPAGVPTRVSVESRCFAFW